jgi:hypothetical protein
MMAAQQQIAIQALAVLDSWLKGERTGSLTAVGGRPAFPSVLL